MSILEETETISVKKTEINSQATLNDIVFENRNKEYGAFIIRKEYGRYVTVAVVISAVVFFVGLVSPLIYNKYKPAEQEEIVQEVDLELMEVKDEKPEEEIPVEPPPPAEEPPKVAMSEFLEPEVTKDEQVVKDPPKNDDIVNPGPVDQDGDANLNDVISDGNGSGNAIVEAAPSNEPLLYVPEMPEFKGNMEEFFRKNVVYPTKAQNNGIEGKVFVQFVINTDGTVTDVKAIRGIGYGCDEEAERVTKKMVWTPGKQNGVPVRIKKVLPIHFKLPD
ncbi:TonB family protein [Sporocytophaga myxococcoides]|uniref:TonB family protein n=1 Tax=Sporocytophaga myxococcoides TaxID=153721 RepID=A0A098LKG3_9BACT|nr:energy transducer TonB [Sporocytophaga myxococcoides]GAL86802.1 TonB family protein [Sporocytophaga myxococcoides]